MNFWEYRARRLELILSAPPASKMSDQKFWALLSLMGSILGMAAISILISAVEKDGHSTDPTVLQAKLAILNMAMGGLIGGFGAACQAFFRTSQTDQDTASALKNMAASLPVAPTLGSPAAPAAPAMPEAPAAPAGAESTPAPPDVAAAADDVAAAATERADEIGGRTT